MRMAPSLRVLALMVAGVLSVTLLAAAAPDTADAAHACRIPVTTRLDLSREVRGEQLRQEHVEVLLGYRRRIDGRTVQPVCQRHHEHLPGGRLPASVVQADRRARGDRIDGSVSDSASSGRHRR